MVKAPTSRQLQEYLSEHDLLGLNGATVELIARRNHLIWEVTKGSRVLAIRMINPESYRRGEWISMQEEYALLKAIEGSGLGPKVYALCDTFAPPFLIQEFVCATCFNDMKPLALKNLSAVATAIARLNAEPISPERFPFMQKYVRRGYDGAATSWYFRLADSVRHLPRRDVVRWVLRIMPFVGRTRRILLQFAKLLPEWYSFHFDGAHCGNTYKRNGRVMFLDWQKVSWRNDPTFTLVRFAISVGEKGIASDEDFDLLIRAYLQAAGRDIFNFSELCWARLLERQTADLVWVLWDAARRKDNRVVEEGTSVVQRYLIVKEMLGKSRW